jgi:hypothetical protein
MSLAERFGASVSLSLPGRGLFLLVAHRAADLPGLIRNAQGQLVCQLSPLRALALMSLPAYLSSGMPVTWPSSVRSASTRNGLPR